MLSVNDEAISPADGGDVVDGDGDSEASEAEHLPPEGRIGVGDESVQRDEAPHEREAEADEEAMGLGFRAKVEHGSIVSDGVRESQAGERGVRI